MPRPTPLLLALALAPLPGAAQQKTEAPPAAPATPEVQAAIKREVEKAKEELRDEIRARVQDRQAKDDFFEGPPPTAEVQKLDLLQLEGAFRLRGDLLDTLALKRAPDPSGYTLFPLPIGSPSRGSLTSANLRLRLDPRLNVSEAVRVLAQLDLLSGQLLGETPAADGGPAGLFASAASPPSPLRVNRAWAEVQTPVGLLSFGRMPSQFGLGIFANAGTDLDADFGDAADRVQLAIPVRQTLLGPVVLVPHYDLVRTGLVSQVPVPGGQPFDLDKTDDAWVVGVKLMRLDTDDELQRKLDKGGSSLNWGGWYSYRAVGYDITPATGTPGDPGSGTTATNLRRAANAHAVDLWGRWRTKRFRLELEAVGIVGTIQDGLDPGETATLRQVLVREFGAVVQADWRLSDGKLLLGVEAGWASGDGNPGFGNRPGRGIPQPGDVEGRQFAVGD
ncbi:MAG TPA: TIGR04551 family protein, partial [Anaeromyxobacteraceae bacterium]